MFNIFLFYKVTMLECVIYSESLAAGASALGVLLDLAGHLLTDEWQAMLKFL
jgi:hypothetical protein